MSDKKTSKPKATSTIAKSDDGTIQITFTIPFSQIEEARRQAVLELGKDIEVPGFRKGMAPFSKVIEKIPENTLLEKTLSLILPKLFYKSVKDHKISPAIYPKFELIKAKENEDWQIRATTCEIPKINLGNYKTAVAGKIRVQKIWTPSDHLVKEKQGKNLTREEKEQTVIEALLESIDVKIPKILIEEETNSRLSKLLERLEKLGLSLESYLSSIKKTSGELRSEYEKQAQKALALDLILTKIAEEENLEVDPKDIQKAFEAASADPKLHEELNTPERRKFIEAILKRRKALSFLTSLIS